MIKYIYYTLAIVYSVFLIFTLIFYVTKAAPTGDATIGWARGIFYSIGLFVFLVIGLLFWKKPIIGVLVYCIPIAILATPSIRSRLTDLYAVTPPLKSVPPLTLTIQNTTRATVHVQLNCWFSTSQKGTSSLYKTMDYTVEPLQTKDYTFTNYETNLLASKSNFVSVMMYEQVKMQGQDVTYTKEIQPCMQTYDEQIEAFGKGHYTIIIDSTKNTPTFKSTVKQMKEQDGYGTGVF